MIPNLKSLKTYQYLKSRRKKDSYQDACCTDFRQPLQLDMRSHKNPLLICFFFMIGTLQYGMFR
jgi:hypothetical protein